MMECNKLYLRSLWQWGITNKNRVCAAHITSVCNEDTDCESRLFDTMPFRQDIELFHIFKCTHLLP